MVTPFHADLEVNYKEARRIAAYLVDDMQNDGLVVAGTTGESPTLSAEEKLRLLEEVIDEVGDRAAVVFGAGSYDTRESIHMTREGVARGADGIMIVNPYYNKPGQDGLYAHFRAIAESTEASIMVYNIIPRSAINLETDVLMKLAELPNIKAVKEASGDINQISDVCRRKPEGFRVYSGDDGLTLPMLALGAHGLVSVASHIVGREYKEMIETFETNPARARELHHQVTPTIKAMFKWPSPTPVKYALSRRGFDTSVVRLPLVAVNEEAQSFINSIL